MRIALVDPSRVTRMLEARGHAVVAFADELVALAQNSLITSAELKTMSGVELCWEAR